MPSSPVPLVRDVDPTYTHFTHRSEFLESLKRLLELGLWERSTEKDDEDEEALVANLGAILDFYLPLPGLLDPSLDLIVSPLMGALQTAAHMLEEQQQSNFKSINPRRLERLGRVLNWVVKVRGWKAVVPHFPSSISNLPLLVSLLSPPASPSSSSTPATPHHPVISSPSAWELRAVLLLWLALLLTVPFNLSALSDSDGPVASVPYGIDLPSATLLFRTPTSQLAQRVILLAVPLLNRPGKEGAYSALVLARLLSREDAVHSLRGFLDWAAAEIHDSDREGEANLIASLFEFLALMPSLLKSKHLTILENFLEENLLPHLRGSRTAADSGLIRKLAIKAKGRLWMAKIGKKHSDGDGMEPPEGLEQLLDDLMGGLSDKDTIARYSSAKYLARIASLLAPSFSSQVVLATVALFEGTEDEPVVTTSFGTVVDPGGSTAVGGTMGFGGLETQRGEARWHGVCLALAEMARRGLVEDEGIDGSIQWAIKALTFDLRRASHSIGSNVRDAAAYLLWSLSRACLPQAIAPFAGVMATKLVCVAVFDREVGVRRAASAAFQEGVGRLGLYPEGIDVLAKTDFYSVSVRRMAFTVAAPAVGIHKVYRDAMIEHLHNITLCHWDSSLRRQGASALKSLLEQDNYAMVEESVQRAVKELASLDSSNVHGALVALTKTAELFVKDDYLNQTIFESLSHIRPAALVSSQAADLISASCDLITTILNEPILASSQAKPTVSKYLELAGKRREPEVHESMARLYKKLSTLKYSEKDVNKLLSDMKTFRVSQRQAATLCLGQIQFPSVDAPIIESVVQALLGLLKDPVKFEVESRRWAVRSLADIAVQRIDEQVIVSKSTFRTIVQALLTGLTDYSTDQRGDVGSWVRIASLNALGRIFPSIPPNSPLISPEIKDQVIGGIVKQGAEKLEAVRSAAALALAEMRENGWTWEGVDHMKADLEQLQGEGFRYIDQETWYRGAMPLLESRFRSDLVGGLVYSIGSQVTTLSNAASGPLLDYLTDHTSVTVPLLVDLLSLLTTNFTSNRIFVPTLQTVNRLLQTRIWEKASEVYKEDISTLLGKMVVVSTKGLGSIKSIERISGAMRMVISCLPAQSSISSTATELVPLFLAHRFPRIRSMASEEMYLTLSGLEDEMEEELEDALLETNWVGGGSLAEADRIVGLLRRRNIFPVT